MQIQEVVDMQKSVTADYHNLPGNHDNNVQATYESNAGYPMHEVLTVEELAEVMENKSSSQTEVCNPEHPTDYYVDMGDIRVICISADETTWTEETAAWLETTALKTADPVLVLSHIPTRPEWGFKNDVQNGERIEAALSDWVMSGGTVIAFIHGHDHGDMINEVLENDKTLFAEVAVGCARFQVPTSNGTEGMIFQERNSEDATRLLFDVVSIDTGERSVKFIRFGAGEDRTISY